MEIIHLILGKANPLRMNGVNKVVHELATKQQAAGYKVGVWGITATPIHDYPARNYATSLFKKRRNPFLLPRDMERAIARQGRQTVFHIHGAFLPVMYSAASLMEDLDIPYVVTPHGSYSEPAMKKNALVKSLYFRLFERPLLQGAAAIHLLGDTEREGLHEWYHSRKTVQIPYGFDALRNETAGVQKEGPFIIGYCGRMVKEKKGLDLLITGFQRFHKVHPESRLWMIGDGEDRVVLEQIVAEQGLEKAVVWHGAKYGDEKLVLLQQCDVFAHTSRYEGLPAAMLEAAALGIPLLITEGTNAGKCVREYGAGVVLPEASTTCVADGMTRLYRDMVTQGKAPGLRAAALKMIREAFAWESLVGRYQQMYLKAVA